MISPKIDKAKNEKQKVEVLKLLDWANYFKRICTFSTVENTSEAIYKCFIRYKTTD